MSFLVFDTFLKIGSACLVFASIAMLLLGRSDQVGKVTASDQRGAFAEFDMTGHEIGSADPEGFDSSPENHSRLDPDAKDLKTASRFSVDTQARTGEDDHTPTGRDPRSDKASALTKTAWAKPDSVKQPMLRIGRIGDVPDVDSVERLSRLPLREHAIRAAYHNAAQNACSLVREGVAVMEANHFEDGTAGRFGRVNAMTIGLRLDESGRDKLPSITTNQVIEYFRKHRVVVQPMLLHGENANFYFANETKAAFYDLSRASLSLTPEPMIEAAVRRFCGLGLTSSESLQEPALRDSSLRDASLRGASRSRGLDGRTLAMAFVFEKETGGLASTRNVQYVHELLFLHIPENFDPADPKLELFITQDSRSTLHRVSTRSNSRKESTTKWLTGPAADLTATVRFGGTTLMGMYPAKPIVTDVSFVSDGSISMVEVKRLLDDKHVVMTQLLDRFDDHASLSGSPGTDSTQSPDSFDSWLERARQQKHREFEADFSVRTSAKRRAAETR